ncbi:uncharacterized protein LOC128248833 [Octopus bimaculoides]|nr:uncharacterized protein LOC128248833 [Octopus bimaculoides]
MLVVVGIAIYITNFPVTRLQSILTETYVSVHLNIEAIQSYLTLVIFLITFVISVIGITGCMKTSLVLLKWELVLSCLMFICDSGFLAFANLYFYNRLSDISDQWIEKLSMTLFSLPNTTDDFLQVMADIESTLLCCGVTNSFDYEFYADFFGEDLYPKSCCYDPTHLSYDCSSKHPPRSRPGCYEVFSKLKKNQVTLLIEIILALISLQVIIILCTFKIVKDIKANMGIRECSTSTYCID